MSTRDRITDLNIERLLAQSKGEKATHIKLIADLMKDMEATGLGNLSASMIHDPVLIGPGLQSGATLRDRVMNHTASQPNRCAKWRRP